MCRVLEVSTSGYYAWRSRGPSERSVIDMAVTERIRETHKRSRGTYGSPRIHAELQAQGLHVARKRVARLMKAAGLRGVTRRRWVTTTKRREGARPAPDHVDRTFEASGPEQVWCADITYIPTAAGFLYLAVVIDVWSRRIVGWGMSDRLKSALVVGALDMALHNRRPAPGEVIHHSDQGCQYTSIAFGERCRNAGVVPSMGSVGDCYDNALCESFFATLECELLDRERYRTRGAARRSVFEYIEGWYNPHRRHSALGYQSPMEFERMERQPLAHGEGAE